MENTKDVPYIVHEGIVTRLERTIEKLWILCIILIVLLVGTNGAWLYYENQFIETEVTQEIEATSDDNSDLNINTVGGDFYGGNSEGETDGEEAEP